MTSPSRTKESRRARGWDSAHRSGKIAKQVMLTPDEYAQVDAAMRRDKCATLREWVLKKSE